MLPMKQGDIVIMVLLISMVSVLYNTSFISGLFVWFLSYDGLLAAAKRFGVKKGIALGVSLALVYFIVFLTYSASFW